MELNKLQSRRNQKEKKGPTTSKSEPLSSRARQPVFKFDQWPLPCLRTDTKSKPPEH